jgi:acetyl-CoA carboxylase biotin carboxyl carrier protein
VSLTSADVAEIMRLVEQSSFDELTLEMDGIKLTLRRGAAANGAGGAPLVDAAVNASGGAAKPAEHTTKVALSAPHLSPDVSTGPASTAAPTDPNIKDVPAPLLGTFYRAPKPGAPPFVEVGATVEEDTVVAIIEVMKLMNTVRAGVRGTVTEILARDGTLVEYGATLLRVRKAG